MKLLLLGIVILTSLSASAQQPVAKCYALSPVMQAANLACIHRTPGVGYFPEDKLAIVLANLSESKFVPIASLEATMKLRGPQGQILDTPQAVVYAPRGLYDQGPRMPVMTVVFSGSKANFITSDGQKHVGTLVTIPAKVLSDSQ